MIYTMNIGDFKSRNTPMDEVYLIIRSASVLEKRRDDILNIAKVLPVLSPSQDLFYRYLNWSRSGQWNIEVFENSYRPSFTSQINNDANAMAWLDYLAKVSDIKNVALLCFCKDVNTCHRKIVGEMIRRLGGHVEIM